MSRRVATIAIGLLVALPPLVSAQPLAPPAMQLPIRGTSSCLYEDYVGFVWRCTDRGIVRFDGREEVTFATDTSDLRAILRGLSGGQDRVGAASGLYVMRSHGTVAGTVRLERFASDTQVAAVNELVEFPGGSIGVATDDGALRLADGKLSEIEFGLPDDRASRVVHVLLQPEPGILLAGTTSGLYLLYYGGRTETLHDSGRTTNERRPGSGGDP